VALERERTEGEKAQEMAAASASCQAAGAQMTHTDDFATMN
jgi:hypothetical protein